MAVFASRVISAVAELFVTIDNENYQNAVRVKRRILQHCTTQYESITIKQVT